MKLLDGKKGLILGVANQRSIAWGIAERCAEQGASLAFTYLNEALEKRVRPLATAVGAELILPCDVQKDEDIDAMYAEIKSAWGELDFVIHSVAYANGEDLKGPFSQTSRKGFQLAMDVSAFSLLAITRGALPLLKPGSSVLAMTYLGAEKVVPKYKVMGVAKAALEACVRELAVELGEAGIRVNAISAGPIRTLAASGISDFRSLVSAFQSRAPLGRMTTIEDVGGVAVYLASELASAVTGEIHYVDCGFNVTAA